MLRASQEPLLRLRSLADGSSACILCGVCRRTCPVGAISIRRPRRGPRYIPGDADRAAFLHDEDRCLACGRCVRACALGALEPTRRFREHRKRWEAVARKGPRLRPGHRLCSGCGASVVVNQVLAAIDGPYVVAAATGCLQVSTTIYPYTSWDGSYIHAGFENAAAVISGAEAAYNALRRRGRLPDEPITFLAVAGDGGTFDIGLQALSGAVERGHRFLYVCYDNGAYMNTGFQRSGATPFGAWTTTSPAGAVSSGKQTPRKPITEVMAGHRMPYAAQASPHDPGDLQRKVRMALACGGPAFLNILSPCPRGWRCEGAESIELARLATETCVWPLYEAVRGRFRLTYRPARRQPVRAWLERQGRFAHLFQPGREDLLEAVQRQVDEEWEWLLERCGEPPEAPGQAGSDSRGRNEGAGAAVGEGPDGHADSPATVGNCSHLRGGTT